MLCCFFSLFRLLFSDDFAKLFFPLRFQRWLRSCLHSWFHLVLLSCVVSGCFLLAVFLLDSTAGCTVSCTVGCTAVCKGLGQIQQRCSARKCYTQGLTPKDGVARRAGVRAIQESLITVRSFDSFAGHSKSIEIPH